jgi:hypothetical protein
MMETPRVRCDCVHFDLGYAIANALSRPLVQCPALPANSGKGISAGLADALNQLSLAKTVPATKRALLGVVCSLSAARYRTPATVALCNNIRAVIGMPAEVYCDELLWDLVEQVDAYGLG